MLADGAELRCLVRVDQMVAAVTAFPRGRLGLGEYGTFFDGGQQLLVTLLVSFFNGGDAFEHDSQLDKAFFPGFLGHARVHFGPFLVLTCCSFFEIRNGVANAFQGF